MTAPQYRHDPVRDQWVIIAPERANRPGGGIEPCPVESAVATPAEDENPFLAGHEHLTPGELYAVRDVASRADAPGWRVRVVPNRYPAVSPEVSAPPRPSGTDQSWFQSDPAGGQHEVIIECPDFETEFAQLSPDQMAAALTAYRDRLAAVEGDGRFDYAMVFKNSGTAAGASLPHVHSQLVAMKLVPPVVQSELQRMRRHFEETGRPLLADLAARENDAKRHVATTNRFEAFCPFASRFGYETWVVPRAGTEPFAHLADSDVTELADVLQRILKRLQEVVPGAPYNFVLHTTPFSTQSAPWFRWRLEICPRLAGIAGFELGTGCFVNVVSPEHAAEQLRGSNLGGS